MFSSTFPLKQTTLSHSPGKWLRQVFLWPVQKSFHKFLPSHPASSQRPGERVSNPQVEIWWFTFHDNHSCRINTKRRWGEVLVDVSDFFLQCYNNLSSPLQQLYPGWQLLKTPQSTREQWTEIFSRADGTYLQNAGLSHWNWDIWQP